MTTSAFFYASSGTPLQTEMSEFGIPFYPFGRGDLGSTPAFNQTDIYLAQEFRMGGDRRLQIQFNVLNLFDQMIVTNRDLTPYQASLNLDDPVFFAGFDAKALGAGLLADPAHNVDGGYGMTGANGFQGRRAMRFGVKLIF